MDKFLIKGTSKISGELTVQGCKNSVLPILAATLLTDKPCVIRNCPDITDVAAALKILKHLGCDVIENFEENTVVVCAENLASYEIPDQLMREMRSSVIFLGAILGRTRRAKVSYPGGCELGPRPIDLHITSLERMGVIVNEDRGFIDCDAKKLMGNTITLNFASVGATENIMLAAVLAGGVTNIINAAKEPEIEDLANFLNLCGAKISGAGTSLIRIEGVKSLKKAEFNIMPDRIVATTYMACAAITGGELLLKSVNPNHLTTINSLFIESGCDIKIKDDSILISRSGPIYPLKLVKTGTYPNFPTDALAPFSAYLTLAQGNSVFIETIFQNRFKHVEELIRLGARFKTEGRLAIVEGVEYLSGSKLVCTDLRGGASLIVAALAAQGETEISKIHHVERGYEKIDEILSSVGADIRKI